MMSHMGNTGCKGFCERYYIKNITKSLEGIKIKSNWAKCPKCHVYWRFSSIKSYLCPCCHSPLQKRKRIIYKVELRKQKKKDLNKAWYEKNRLKMLDYFKAYYLKKKAERVQTKSSSSS